AHHDVNVAPEVRDRPSEPVARPGHAGDPSHTTSHIVKNEPAILHLTAPGPHRREGPDDRHEAGDDDRLRPVARVEHPSPLDVAGVEQERLGPREEPRPETNADGVADAVPGDRGDDEHEIEPPDVEP